MNRSSNFFFNIILAGSLIGISLMPKDGLAQRFGHPNFGGGGGSHPSAPPQNFSRPSSPPTNANRPAQPSSARSSEQVQRPPQPAQQHFEPRQTINGGSYPPGNRNFTEHGYNQNVAPAARPAEPVHNNAPVHNVVVRDNVNVYHNHYQPPHAYVYHPYHPYYWGHNWHAPGYFVASLAADAFFFSLANRQYYYDEGVYYQPSQGGYSVVPAPVGALVSSLPPGYETTMVGDTEYFYYGGVFYVDTGNGYQVVAAPYGAVITQIPDGAVQQVVNGETLLVYNNTYYEPVMQDGQDAYQVIQVGNN